MQSSPAQPTLYTCLSPALLNLYEVSNSIIVIIDVLRATSTIATALYNGAKSIIPVKNVAECIKLGSQMDVITAGERDGRIAEGLMYGNSPFTYSKEFISGKTLVLTTTNGTKLLHMALAEGAKEIISASFPNLSSVCNHLLAQNRNVILACAAWKNKVNLEDTLFAGAVINKIKNNFCIDCDSSGMAESLYHLARENMFEYIKNKNASHFHRLMNYGLEKDIRYCLTENIADVLAVYKDGRIISQL